MGYTFVGWYTLPEGGIQVNENTIINGNITFYAHWIKSIVARINSTEYDTIQGAVDAITANIY